MKELSSMGKEMDFILLGIRMDRSLVNQLIRMGKKMDYILLGMRMDRKVVK